MSTTNKSSINNDDDKMRAGSTSSSTTGSNSIRASGGSWIPKLPPVVQRIEQNEKMPICLIVVGMAGSGKSSLMQQLHSNLEEKAIEKAEMLEAEQDKLKQKQDQEQKHPANEKQQQQQQQQQQQNEAEQDDENDTDSKISADDNNNNDDDDDIEIDETWYCVNLDPATLNVDYDVSIDIRDTINYKQVMKQHKLGPNGAIMTSLNLFATKFDQVISLIEKRCFTTANADNDTTHDNINSQATTISSSSDKEKVDDAAIHNTPNTTSPPPSSSSSTIEYILVDTPGQIEAFTWSASGSIICESLASICPTVIVFVIDTVRCAASPNTFMSNMLYACSILYRTRLPIVIAFNKIDVVSHQFCMEWMHDYETFQQALDDDTSSSANGTGGGFYSSLTRSLSLSLDEFYSNFVNAVGVSAVTGQGIDEFWTTVQKAASHDFVLDYIDELKLRVEEQSIKQQAIARADIKRLQRDVQRNNNNK
jgi:GPN-loop GTPase